MNTIIQERNNHNETCITVKVSRRTQKVVFMLANDTSVLAFCSTHLVHIFGDNVGDHFGVLMKGKVLMNHSDQSESSITSAESSANQNREPIVSQSESSISSPESSANQNREPIVSQSESSITSPESSANQNRASESSLRHPRAVGAWTTLFGSRLESTRYSLS